MGGGCEEPFFWAMYTGKSAGVVCIRVGNPLTARNDELARGLPQKHAKRGDLSAIPVKKINNEI